MVAKWNEYSDFLLWPYVTPMPREGSGKKDTVIRSLDGATWNEGRIVLKKIKEKR